MDVVILLENKLPLGSPMPRGCSSIQYIILDTEAAFLSDVILF